MNSVAPIQKKSIRFRARSFVAFALTPEAPLDDWLQGLDRWVENSPGFFAGRPVVLDLSLLALKPGEIASLISQLAERAIRIYAIESLGLDHLGPDLPPLLKGARESVIEEMLAPAAEVPPASSTLIVETPVRSGQSIFHPDGDVIVLGSVASGSEIIAGGSVHVYGALRGRAFAGATGNAKARIFCRKNESELFALDGFYLTAEEMAASTRGVAIQAFLENGVIRVVALS